MRSISAVVTLVAATLGGSAAAQPVMPAFHDAVSVSQGPESQALLQPVQFRRFDAFRDRRYWDRRYGRGYFDRHFRGYRRDTGAALAAGFLGFVLGAAIAGSANQQAYARAHLSQREWIAECARRYRSFDAGSGTYLGYDGYRHYCTL